MSALSQCETGQRALASLPCPVDSVSTCPPCQAPLPCWMASSGEPSGSVDGPGLLDPLSYEGLFWAMLAWILWGLVVDSLCHLWVAWCPSSGNSAAFPYDE